MGDNLIEETYATIVFNTDDASVTAPDIQKIKIGKTVTKDSLPKLKSASGNRYFSCWLIQSNYTNVVFDPGNNLSEYYEGYFYYSFTSFTVKNPLKIELLAYWEENSEIPENPEIPDKPIDVSIIIQFPDNLKQVVLEKDKLDNNIYTISIPSNLFSGNFSYSWFLDGNSFNAQGTTSITISPESITQEKNGTHQILVVIYDESGEIAGYGSTDITITGYNAS
jgi:hypothetical protein